MRISNDLGDGRRESTGRRGTLDRYGLGTTLLVFAHADEAVAFAQAGVPHLVTGVGKINATLRLSEALLTARARSGNDIHRVIVCGTAGAVSDEVRFDTVYQIDGVLQHDFSLASPMLVPAGELLACETARIATGDMFVQNDAQRAAIARLGVTLVDMESYAYAAVCARIGVPLQVFKVASDFADSGTTQSEWDERALLKSQQLFDFARLHHLGAAALNR